MNNNNNDKLQWWHIDNFNKGKELIDITDLWKCEFYVISSHSNKVFNVRHFEYVNSFIKDLIADNNDFYWIACGTKKRAYDTKEMLQARYVSDTDRQQQKEVREWK